MLELASLHPATPAATKIRNLSKARNRRGISVSPFKHSNGRPYLLVNIAPATARSWGLQRGDRVEVVSGSDTRGAPVLGLRGSPSGRYRLRGVSKAHQDRVMFTIALSSLDTSWAGVTARVDCKFMPQDGFGFLWPRGWEAKR